MFEMILQNILNHDVNMFCLGLLHCMCFPLVKHRVLQRDLTKLKEKETAVMKEMLVVWISQYHPFQRVCCPDNQP